MGQNGPYKAIEIVMADGNKVCTCRLKNLYTGQEATVRTDMDQQIGSKLGKEYIKAVYCHPAYLTYFQSAS